MVSGNRRGPRISILPEVVRLKGLGLTFSEIGRQLGRPRRSVMVIHREYAQDLERGVDRLPRVVARNAKARASMQADPERCVRCGATRSDITARLSGRERAQDNLAKGYFNRSRTDGSLPSLRRSRCVQGRLHRWKGVAPATATKDTSPFGHVRRTLEEVRSGSASTQQLAAAAAILEQLHDGWREFLRPQEHGKGAIRFEDWNSWPQSQRDAFEELEDLLGLVEYAEVASSRRS